MGTIDEIKSPNEYQAKKKYINECWRGWRENWQSALIRINTYLFTLNTGGLLVSLTYVATKSSNASIEFTIWLFATGILFSLLHAAIDYYTVELNFDDFKKDVEKFYDNNLDWKILVEKNENRGKKTDWILHLLGWSSGVSFCIALISGILQIKTT